MVIDDQPVSAAITHDRSTPIGNSLSPNSVQGSQRRRLHVYVDQGMTEPIPVIVTDEEPGTPIHEYNQEATDPGNDVTVLTATVPVGKTWAMSRIDLTCRAEGVGYLKVGGTPVGSFRTGAAHPRDKIEFTPRKSVGATVTIEVVFKARTGSPITDVECLFQALES